METFATTKVAAPATVQDPVAGINFDFGGGKVFTLAPLTLGFLSRLQEPLKNMATFGATDAGAVDTIIEAAHASLRRNYDYLSRDDVADMIDVGNMYDVLGCVLDVAGLKRKEAEKNQQAQSTTEPLTADQPIGPT